MIASILMIAQSVTPYGSPVPEIQHPSTPMTMAEVRFNDCVELSIKDPISGIVEASNWRQQGGGYLASHCLGYAYAEQFNWPQASKPSSMQRGLRKPPMTRAGPNSGRRPAMPRWPEAILPRRWII